MKKLFGVAAIACALAAQSPTNYPLAHTFGADAGPMIVPTVKTSLVTQTVFATAWHFHVPKTGTATTVYLLDNSTNCGGAACELAGSDVAPGQQWNPDTHGVRFNNGLSWYASGAGVTGWVKWSY